MLVSAMLHVPPAHGMSLLPLLPASSCSGGLSRECNRAEAAVAIWTVYLVWSNYAKKAIIILCSLD